MATLTRTDGDVTVHVEDEAAIERLKTMGYKPTEEPKQSTRRTAAKPSDANQK